MKDLFNFALETLKMALLAFLIVFPIRYFIFQPFVVSGNSMDPNFQDSDYLIIDEITFRFRDPERGEVVVFRAPLEPSQRYIKRVIGLPGETIKITGGHIYLINPDVQVSLLDENEYLEEEIKTLGDIEVILGENEYYVLGDNRIFSSDSRSWGVLPRKNIIGRALFRVLPVKTLGAIETPQYSFSNQEVDPRLLNIVGGV